MRLAASETFMTPLALRMGVLGEVVEPLSVVPEWLVLGVLVGAACSLCVAGIFVLGERLSPTRSSTGKSWSGDDRRREEIRHYLQAIDEQFAEDHAVEGSTVAFYLPERDVAITFDARAFYRIERSPTHAVLVEHEMPGLNLGHRLPFETPDLEFGEAEAGGADSPEAAFAVLGVPDTASPPEIKTAYREKAKEVHPDHGGDREEFQRLREAYTTAKQAAS